MLWWKNTIPTVSFLVIAFYANFTFKLAEESYRNESKLSQELNALNFFFVNAGFML